MNQKVRAIRGKAGILGRTVDFYNGHRLIFSKIIHSDAHELEILKEAKRIIRSRYETKGEK